MAARAVLRGFTLIELMVALAIAALLVTLGLPSFTQFLRNSEIRSTTESLVNGLRVARTEAVRRNVPAGVKFTLVAGGPGWTVDQVSPASNIQTYSKSEGGTNTAVAITPAGAVSVTFNGLGRICPKNGNGCTPAVTTDNLTQLDVSSAIAPGSRSLRIYVDDAHGIRTCDPALTSTTDPRAC